MHVEVHAHSAGERTPAQQEFVAQVAGSRGQLVAVWGQQRGGLSGRVLRRQQQVDVGTLTQERLGIQPIAQRGPLQHQHRDPARLQHIEHLATLGLAQHRLGGNAMGRAGEGLAQGRIDARHAIQTTVDQCQHALCVRGLQQSINAFVIHLGRQPGLASDDIRERRTLHAAVRWQWARRLS